ncbi:unnamed protein product [Hapterophycus canaliculatus]
MSDHSPHRSPIHRLTESLQKWDAGSRYASPLDDENIGERIDLGGDGEEVMHAGAAGGSGGSGGGGGVKEVGASWNGQELRRTLEKERLGRGRRRRHSAASAQDMYPQGRFGDHSPISPASSAASVNVGEFDASTPAIAGRPWRSSPRRAEGGAAVSGGSARGKGDDDDRIGGGAAAGEEGAGSAEHFGIVRMEGSWSDDETGPSGTVMKLAFSPGKISADAQTPTAAGGLTAAETAGGQRTKGSGAGGSPRSPLVPAESRADLLEASPEQPALRSVRDLMDQGTDDEEGGQGDSNQAALVRRRRRRQRPELALRTLEMPDAMDTTVGAGPGDPAAARACRTPSCPPQLSPGRPPAVSKEPSLAAGAPRLADGGKAPRRSKDLRVACTTRQ